MAFKRRQPWSNPNAEGVVTATHRKQKNRRFGLLLFAAFIFLSVLGGALVYWKKDAISSRVRTFQGNLLTSQAQSALEKGDIRNAASKISAALKKNPRNPNTLRTAIALELNYSPSQTISLLRTLDQLGHATTEERITLLGMLVEQERLSEAGTLANTLIREHPDNTKILNLTGRIHLALENRDAALTVLRHAERIDPGNHGVQLTLAQAHLGSPLPDVRQLAWQALFNIARNDASGPDGLEALNIIFNHRDRLSIALDQFFDLYKNHPLRPSIGDPTLDLLAWQFDLDSNNNPESKNNIARESIAVWNNANLAPADLDNRLKWLIQNDTAPVVAAFLAENPPEPHPDRIGSTLIAFVLADDFNSADSFLRKLSEAGHQALAAAGRASLAASKKENHDAVAEQFERAILLASQEASPSSLLRIGTVAANLNHLDVARRAFELASNTAPLKSHQALASIATQEGNHDALLTHLETLLELDPDNQKLLLKTTFLQLLLRVHLDQAEAATNRLLAANPDEDNIRLLSAFSHLVFERNDEALTLATQINPDNLLNNLRVPLVAIFASTGNQAAARKVAALITRDTLKPEELTLLTKYVDPDAPPGKSAPPAPAHTTPSDTKHPYLPQRDSSPDPTSS
ncbi:MAG: tetratricopeptide repeat protein [Verrucomicrobiota bacterium]